MLVANLAHGDDKENDFIVDNDDNDVDIACKLTRNFCVCIVRWLEVPVV